jgi:hypothetical protein
MSSSTEKAEITYRGMLDMQVCVPRNWTDEQVVSFANAENPCGTVLGWGIRRDGDAERVPCREYDGFVHLMLDA